MTYGRPVTVSAPGLTPPAPWQGSLFGHFEPTLTELRPVRDSLDRDCWIDRHDAWILGGDALFCHLHSRLPWQHGRRPMYDRMVDVPRLTSFLPRDDERFPDIVRDAATALGHRYRVEFSLIGANLYRSGRDSVAWHADRIGRLERNPLIAIVSLGARRLFRLRPGRAGDGSPRSVPMYSGDLLVMGGACQHRWEHAVPKVASAGPRMSLTFRHGDAVTAGDPLRRALPPSG